MIDIELLRREPEKVRAALLRKGFDLPIEKFLSIDKERRALQVQIDNLRGERNKLTVEDAKVRGPEIKKQLSELEDKLTAINELKEALGAPFEEYLRAIPNIPTDDTPDGANEDENKVLEEVGAKPHFDFTPKEHWQLGEELDVIDNETAAKVSGARFTYLKGKLVQLQFALIQYALSVLTDTDKLAEIRDRADLPDTFSLKPFVPVVPPVMIRPETFDAMARLEPKDERYYIPSDNLYLVGSAEHTLGPLHMDEIIPAAQLPIRYVGYSTAFRREAGTYGKDTKGILRLHQFDKVEMESFSAPDQSYDEHRFFIAIQEYLMSSLGIAYRTVQSCAGDLGGPNARKVDIEAWLPGQDQYRETHSADYMTDYQARRLGTRVRTADGSVEPVHTNDATVFAIGRTLIAIMENYQHEDGSITVPDALVPFCGFKKITAQE